MTFFRGGHLWSLALLVTALVVVQASPSTFNQAYRVKQKVASGVALSADETRLFQQIQSGRLQSPKAVRSSRENSHVPAARPPHNPLDDYQSSPADYNWVDISAVGVPLTLGLDEISLPLDLGFSFDFYDLSYTQVYIASHGFVTFDGQFPDGSWWIETPLPDPQTPNNAIYGMWDDISMWQGGQIYYYNDTANNRFIVSWNSVQHTDDPTLTFTFEIILYDNGNIVYQYQQVATNGSCTVGVENADGTDGLQVCFDASGDCPQENTAILINQPDGLPNPVTNLAGTVVGHTVTLTWIDPTMDTNGNPVTLDSLQVWLGPPGVGQRIGAVNPGVQTFTQNNAPDGNLTYYVRAHHTPYYSAARTVSLIVGNPSYLEDFDIEDGMWVADQGGWEWGAPSSGAHSDPNVWGVGLSGTYQDNSDYYVTLSPGLEIISPSATMEFWMYYNTEQWYDGANFQVSIDEGATWEIVSPPGGYPVQPMWNGEPGWSGMGAGWQYVVLSLSQWNGEVPEFRFHFASDPSVTIVGFFFDDMTIWGLQPPIGATVSGSVTLDGGNGTITQTVVQSNGLDHPNTHPDAQGNYVLDSVIVGDRRITAALAGYHTDTLLVTVPEGGLTNQNLVLRRLDPPAPTNMDVVSVDNNTGVVVLNWNDSPDPLVDSFRVYRKLAANPNWTLVRTVHPSNGTDTLTVDGIYQYSVTAADYDVIPPAVESPRSNSDVALFGELPPTNLVGIGNFDNHVQLNWLPPGLNPAFELSYDDSSSETWMFVSEPYGAMDYFAVRFTPPPPSDEVQYPLPIQTINIYLDDTTPLTNVWIAPDAGGVPAMDSAWMNWQNIGAASAPGWLTAQANGTISLTNENDFWVIWQFPEGMTEPKTGADANSPDNRSYWTWASSWPNWNLWTAHDWMARVWLGGQPGWGDVISVGTPFGSTADHTALASNVSGRGSDQRAASRVAPTSKLVGPVRTNDRAIQSRDVARNSKVTKNPFPVALDQMLVPASHAPALVYQEQPGGHSLDDIQYYRIFRNGVYMGQDLAPPYDDPVPENQAHAYYVTAHYDNNEDSPPSNTITVAAAMAPGAPTNLAGTPVGQSQMHLTWNDPTVNADGSPCTDLANIRVYRDGTLLGTVGPGAQQYVDTPPQNNQFYTWSVRAIDEVPNVSQPTTYYGAVTSPWQQTDYEWVDITTLGTQLTLALDDMSGALPLGFDFEFFGTTYTDVYVTSHGFVTFNPGLPPGAWWMETPLPTPDSPNNAVYGLWNDISSSQEGAIYYYQDNTNGRFIASWQGVGYTGDPNQVYTFEIILDDRGGATIEYQSVSSTTSSSIGAENVDGSQGVQVLYDGDGWQPTNSTAITMWGGPSGEIDGHVRRFGDNAPIASAIISIAQGPEFTTTDADGFYALRLDPGTYTLIFTRQGYCDTTYANVLVEDRNITVRNAVLKVPLAQFSLTSISQLTWPTHDATATFTISDNGGQCPLDFVISDTSSWLWTNPVSGTVPVGQSTEITVVMSPQGLIPGNDYQSSLTVTHDANGSPYIIPVTLSISLATPEHTDLPTSFALYQNYPNPFNATTDIRFDVPQESHVKITLFNVMGQEVATVVNQRYEAGRHGVTYNAVNLPSGMYLMKFDAGSFSSMKKMLLLK